MLDLPWRSPLFRTRALRQLTLANGLVGLASSFVVPFTPLFLAARVGASAAQIGLLLTLAGAAGVLVSSLVGSISDRLPSRKPLIAAGCVATAAGNAVYGLSHDYLVVLAASVTLLTGAWVAVPQLYARGRELLDLAGAAPAPSLSALRSAVSLAWVGGPPLFGLIVSTSGFPLAFLLVAALMLAAAVLVAADGEGGTGDRGDRQAGPARGWSRLLGGGVALATGAVIALQTANSMSVTTMPLLITVTLHGSPRDVGLVFGLTATLEIPAMLGLGRAAGRLGSLPVMLSSSVFGLLYFGFLAVAGTTWQVALAQLLNAVFVPGLVALALVYFHELLREPGVASTLYFNSTTAGSTVAGVLWGAVVVASGYRGALWTCVGLTAAGIAMLGASQRRRRPAP